MGKGLAFIFILFITMETQGQIKPVCTPMFFSMNSEWKDIENDKHVFEFSVKSWDTTYPAPINHELRLLSDSNGAPMLFFSEIVTAVCADGECKLANLNVYWNLLGNYVGYGIPPETPLTKYEHDHFENADYAKLHQLLLDDNSILKRRKMSDLIDKVPVQLSIIDSQDIDGISGATKKEIKESVVKGGLYSCYTLWHIVHSNVKEKMYEYLESIKSESLTHYFLSAPYKDYQFYALKQLDQAGFEEHLAQIIGIFKTTDASTKAYILKKMPNEILASQNSASQLFTTFSDVDVNIRTLLIRKLKGADPMAVEVLSEYTQLMTKNQLSLYLVILSECPASMNKEIKSNLKKAANSKMYAYGNLIKEFLEIKM